MGCGILPTMPEKEDIVAQLAALRGDVEQVRRLIWVLVPLFIAGLVGVYKLSRDDLSEMKEAVGAQMATNDRLTAEVKVRDQRIDDVVRRLDRIEQKIDRLAEKQR